MSTRAWIIFIAVTFLILVGYTAAAANAWPVGSYRGHGTGYYSANGNYYAMDWTHSHSVGSGTCKSGHQHHYSGWLRTPGGYYVRLDDHDHHACAPRH